MEALMEKNILMATQDRCDVKAPIANLLKPECSFMVSNYVHFVKSVGCPDLLYQESLTAAVTLPRELNCSCLNSLILK